MMRIIRASVEGEADAGMPNLLMMTRRRSSMQKMRRWNARQPN